LGKAHSLEGFLHPSSVGLDFLCRIRARIERSHPGFDSIFLHVAIGHQVLLFVRARA
jgi:hypothetical protein